ncbi:hypothetical protein AMTR_s00002p00224580 [Amborella trichopoda]|uniref:Uncharacterized protein n=1 Tax=Amborella trichopoda TaxID=13333 RepID=W1P2L6_AMBTC|nr:hypothetical protein AMTR_s00002p00224580 [Amborella trichopoda]
MSLSCLTCGSPRRRESDMDMHYQRIEKVLGPYEISKSLGPTYHCQTSTTGSTGEVEASPVKVEPQLLRSGACRRDWSFEDLSSLNKLGCT